MATASSAGAAAPAEWQGLIHLAVNEMAAAGLRRLKGWLPSFPVFRATGLGLPIPGLVRGNPDTAAEIYCGRFSLAGTSLDSGGRSIFEHTDAPPAWIEALHSFSWLAHLQASGRELSRVQARSLIREWTLARRRHPAPAMTVGVRARRIIAWVRHAPFLLKGASADFEAGFLAIATAETRALCRQLVGETDHRARLAGAIGLNYASLGFTGLKALWATAQARLAAEIEAQILPDGGHRSRSPAVLLDILIDLLPVRLALEEAKIEVPGELNAALERMVPMLRFFIHGDGGLAAFHGVSDTAAGKVRAVLDLDRVEGRPLVHAIHSGYGRLAHGPCVVIADVGRPPPPGLNRQAGAGPLAFEFSDGASRIVVNCGTPSGQDDDWLKASRLTDAHSTICLGDANAAAIFDNRLFDRVFGTPVILGPRTVAAKVERTADGSILEARHDGYVGRFGIAVERRLYLASSGRDLRGEDRFFADLDRASNIEAVAFTIRFHLHPAVKATLSKDGASVMLLLPDRNGWRFSARGGTIELDDSVYLLGRGGPRRAQQIVVRGTVGRPDRVNWAFKRIDRRTSAGQTRERAPSLPLPPP